MRYITAILTSCCLFAAVASAQPTNTLAEGDPPLTQAMVDRLTGLMQWSLDTEFSDQERNQLQTVIVNYWKKGEEKNIRSVLDTLAFEQKLASASEQQKRDLRPQIRQKLLEEFEKDTDEPMNKVLLAAYNRHHGGDQAISSGPQSGSSLMSLVGKWRVRHGNSLTTQNVYSGAIGEGNGMVAEYDIRPDGRVIFSLYLSQNNYGCTTRIKTSRTGRAVVNGSRVTFAYDSGTTTSEDACNAKYNYTKKSGKTSETFDFEVKRENGRSEFCFSDAKLKDCAVKVD